VLLGSGCAAKLQGLLGSLANFILLLLLGAGHGGILVTTKSLVDHFRHVRSKPFRRHGVSTMTISLADSKE